MSATSAACHILVVDDYADTAEAMAALLVQACPFQISTAIAHDGAEAVALVRTRPPTVAVLDIDMPVMDGVQAARAIRAHLRHAPPLLIALTGNPGRLAAMNVHRAFDHVLSKPVDVDKLIALLNRFRHAASPSCGTTGHDPKTMTHTEEYRKHRIAVSTRAHDDGGFGWEYRVDDGHATRSKKRPSKSEPLAVADALGHAKAQIDAFIWTETRAS